MPESTVGKTVNDSEGRPPKRTAPRWSVDAGEGAFSRLQERTQTQLGFINNLLVTLAIGLLAFEVNASANSPGLDRGWREVVLLLGLAGLALSVLAGLRLAFNRLASHRITTRVARVRELRDRYRSQKGGSYELRGLRRQALSSKTWAWWTHSKETQKQAVHTAAVNLAKLIPENTAKPTVERTGPIADSTKATLGDGQQPATHSVPEITDAANQLIDALRSWYERADDWTWVWLRLQTWCFIAGGLLLLAGPVIYYVFEHRAS